MNNASDFNFCDADAEEIKRGDVHAPSLLTVDLSFSFEEHRSFTTQLLAVRCPAVADAPFASSVPHSSSFCNTETQRNMGFCWTPGLSWNDNDLGCTYVDNAPRISPNKRDAHHVTQNILDPA